MKIESIFTEEDYLQLYLFAAKDNLTIKRGRRIVKMILIFVCLFTFSYLYFAKNSVLVSIIGLVSWSIILGYHHFWGERKVYERLFRKEIKHSLKNRIGVLYQIYFENDKVIMEGNGNKLEIKNNNINCIEETKEYFYLKLKTEDRIILPKRTMKYEEYPNWIKEFAKQNNLIIKNELNWRF